MGVRMTFRQEQAAREQLTRLEGGELLTQAERSNRESLIKGLQARLNRNDEAQNRDANKGRHKRVR